MIFPLLTFFIVFQSGFFVLEIGVSSPRTPEPAQNTSGEGTSGDARVVRRSHTATSSGMVPSAVHNVFDNGLLIGVFRF